MIESRLGSARTALIRAARLRGEHPSPCRGCPSTRMPAAWKGIRRRNRSYNGHILFVCYYDESGSASFHGSRTRSVAAARTARGEGKGRESPISWRLSQPSSDRHRSGAPSFCRLTDQGCVARRGSANPGDCGSYGALGKRQHGGSGHCASQMTGSHRSAPLARRPGHLPLSARGLVAM